MVANPDTLITQVQLALIGVILVVGLFFLWRTVCRIEDKIDALKQGTCMYGGGDTVYDDSFETAEKLMNEVFKSSVYTQHPVDMPTISEEEEEEAPASVAEEAGPEPVPQEEHADSEADNPLSKTKLKKMTVDDLKDICRDRGMSTDGSKNVLIDRILGVSRD